MFKASKLRADCAAVKLSVMWLGTSRVITDAQQDQAAQVFGASSDVLRTSKRIIDTKHPAFRTLTRVRGAALLYYRTNSLPYPEDGIRLIPRAKVQEFVGEIDGFRAQLAEGVEVLRECYDELQAAAQFRLGSLYDPSDYPPADELTSRFAITVSFPSVEPPDYLLHLNPPVYEAELKRVQEEFSAAGRLAQEAFTQEFADLVGTITTALSGVDPETGQKRVLKTRSVDSLHDFFDRFKALSFDGEGDAPSALAQLVAQAQDVIAGRDAKQLKGSAEIREQTRAALAQIAEQLATMTTVQPRRRIRRAQPQSEALAPEEAGLELVEAVA